MPPQNDGQQGWRQMLNALASNVVQRLQPENARTIYESMERFIPPEVRGLIPDMKQTALLGAQVVGPQADVHAMQTSWNNAVRSLLASEQPLSKRLQDFGVGSAYTAAAIPMMGLPGTITWHGSPHKWAAEPGYPHGRPRLDKMGTGEGQQMFGKGHYAGEAKGTGEQYRRELADRAGEHTLPDNTKVPSWVANQKEILASIDQMEAGATATRGTIYKHDIPDADTAKYLDYDAPLDAQPQVVKDAIKRLGFWPEKKTIVGRGYDGGDIWVSMRLQLGEDGATAAMRDAGVPGLRVKDQLSRGKKEGITYNYVTWDQDVLNRAKILEIDDVPVYRGQHQPRGPESGGARLDDMTGGGEVFPDDIYSPKGLDYYGNRKSKHDRESFNIIQEVRNQPDAEVTIYRAVPKGIDTINPGDFVTLSEDYARLHGSSGYGPAGKDAGVVLSKKVKVRDLFSDGNDLNEFGYFGAKIDNVSANNINFDEGLVNTLATSIKRQKK